MPRYFFETDDGDLFHDADSILGDNTGILLINDEAARAEALRALPDMAKEQDVGVENRTLTSAVRNEAGELIYSATLTVAGEWHTLRAEIIPLFPVKVLWVKPL